MEKYSVNTKTQIYGYPDEYVSTLITKYAAASTVSKRNLNMLKARMDTKRNVSYRELGENFNISLTRAVQIVLQTVERLKKEEYKNI